MLYHMILQFLDVYFCSIFWALILYTKVFSRKGRDGLLDIVVNECLVNQVVCVLMATHVNNAGM